MSTIGKDRFNAVKNHYVATGLTTRRHGNTKRTPVNTLSFRETQNAVKFLKSYADNHAILLPGRIPGYKRDDLQLLPSSTTKKVCSCSCFLYTRVGETVKVKPYPQHPM